MDHKASYIERDPKEDRIQSLAPRLWGAVCYWESVWFSAGRHGGEKRDAGGGWESHEAAVCHRAAVTASAAETQRRLYAIPKADVIHKCQHVKTYGHNTANFILCFQKHTIYLFVHRYVEYRELRLLNIK